MSYFAKVVEDEGNTAAAEELRQQIEQLRIRER
jgi:hypothetical protein